MQSFAEFEGVERREELELQQLVMRSLSVHGARRRQQEQAQ